MQPTKWDLVLGTRPIPLIEHLMTEVSRLFAKELAAWPPQVDAFDARTGATLATALEAQPARPDPRLYREAFELTRLDLAREVAAVDDYWRNRRWLSAGLSPRDTDMLRFVSRFMVEQLLSLGEATEGRINRSRMLDVLARTRSTFFAGLNP
jgi:hypothetical protein